VTGGLAAQWNVLAVGGAVCFLILWGIARTRAGLPVTVREARGLATLRRAVRAAVAAGRPVLFVPGTRDLNDPQTVAALAVLRPVARLVAEAGGRLLVPTCRSLVMQEARHAGREGFRDAGRAAAWDDAAVTYVTDDALGFVARVDGMIARERPGACLLFGAFAAESLLLAEGGYQVGAVQVAGSASPVQLPFLVAACDDVLVGEELFAAGAYLCGDTARIGSLLGQDLARLLAIALILIGVIVTTGATLWGGPWATARAVLLDLLQPR